MYKWVVPLILLHKCSTQFHLLTQLTVKHPHMTCASSQTSLSCSYPSTDPAYSLSPIKPFNLALSFPSTLIHWHKSLSLTLLSTDVAHSLSPITSTDPGNTLTTHSHLLTQFHCFTSSPNLCITPQCSLSTIQSTVQSSSFTSFSTRLTPPLHSINTILLPLILQYASLIQSYLLTLLTV